LGVEIVNKFAAFFRFALLATISGSSLAEAPAAPPGNALSQPIPPLPVSSWASKEAHEAYDKLASEPPQPDFHGDVAAMRAWNAKREKQRLKDALARYSVDIISARMGGIPVDIVTPKGGVAPNNLHRVLINLHGGGFMWGAGDGALSEAVPIAVTGRVKVITVDYRMAPEHKFPAASVDVASVYRTLLLRYKPSSIGLYGCSAGGILAAESVAWFQQHGLPRPGAIATLCGTGAEVAGDSGYFAGWAAGQAIPPGGKPLQLVDLPYFQGVDANDPLVFPIESPEVLAKFPPTLLLSGNRDFAASSLTVMHRRLRQAHADSELYIFDGLWHAFVMDPTLPESREAYDIVWDFFDRHLGRSGHR
jgi:acetyl esterase/lipase